MIGVRILLLVPAGLLLGAGTQVHYFGHAATADQYGVIAPWYKGQNGQFDYRVRIAAETLKRYPWTPAGRAVSPAPEYVYDGTWSIDHQGRIHAVEERDWANGDLGQRAAYILASLIDYYVYSGDPAVFTPITAMADYLVDHCQTDARHGWPRMLISVPTMGVRYGDCRLGPSDDLKSGNGKIQLDIVAQVGLELTRAWEMTGNVRWRDAARHWADLLAQNYNRDRNAGPWGRYADNAGANGMNGVQTGGVAIILAFLDELIRTGYSGPHNSLVEARDRGRAYLRDVLLPGWILRDYWGRNFWDWEAPVQDLFGTEYPVLYLMENKEYFSNWKNDVRNILALFINHASVSPLSNGDMFHGAWAYPESSGCCGRSLWYSPMELAAAFARYGVEAESEWAGEIARRSQLLATYDPLADGETMDLIDGGNYVNKSWFKIAHPMALKYVLRTMGWLPEIMGANRENHIVRAGGVVQKVVYGKGRISYSVFDAPAGSIDVLRLSFAPAAVEAGGKPLAKRQDLSGNGYTARALAGGDYILSIRRDGATGIVVTGPDPQSVAEMSGMSHSFTGNQVRLVGRVGLAGGLADVYIDDWRQLTPIDFYSPIALDRQIVYYKNGLENGPHTIRVVPRGARNPLSKGDETPIEAVQFSGATGDSGWGESGGPTGAQRLIFGYARRTDYVDSQGHAWHPGAEFIARTGHLTDAVAKTWWSMQQAVFIQDTPDQELYRYGVHWKDFTVNLTVGPGSYHVRLKFAETQYDAARQRGITIFINGRKMVEGFDVFATAGGADKAVDLVYENIQPRNGAIDLRFVGEDRFGRPSEAMVQAIEAGPGPGGTGAVPKILAE